MAAPRQYVDFGDFSTSLPVAEPGLDSRLRGNDRNSPCNRTAYAICAAMNLPTSAVVAVPPKSPVFTLLAVLASHAASTASCAAL